MNALLEQFILEARDFLQDIGTKLMALENDPDSDALLTELFRLVHTLKGNSGLFDFPEVTRVLHAGEDLMDAVREKRVAYSRALADQLLDAMDFVSLLLDEIEAQESIAPHHAPSAAALADALRGLMSDTPHGASPTTTTAAPPAPPVASAVAPCPASSTAPEPHEPSWALLAHMDLQARLRAWEAASTGKPLHWLIYTPEKDCFFKGEDPFNQARQTPGVLWGHACPLAAWPEMLDFDCFQSQLEFFLLTEADPAELHEHFRYVPEQLRMSIVPPQALVCPGEIAPQAPLATRLRALEPAALAAEANREAAAQAPGPLRLALEWLAQLAQLAQHPQNQPRELLDALLDTLAGHNAHPPVASGSSHQDAPSSSSTVRQEPDPDTASPSSDTLDQDARARLDSILDAQTSILALPDTGTWLPGRIRAVACTLEACLGHLGLCPPGLQDALQASLEMRSGRPLLSWLVAYREPRDADDIPPPAPLPRATGVMPPPSHPVTGSSSEPGCASGSTVHPDADPRRASRCEESPGSKVLKVDQAKVDRLMNLIGEMVVAKNSLPYLANRAENQFGVRELARDIKAQYAVINRIAEEMQDAIMQVRMMPVSFVLQRFPRLVRDISRKLGKEVELVLEGEETEADKNIVEALADPLIHIVRNSLDHGLETPEQRVAAGKSRTGRLLIRASQESDRVQIEIIDDGRGIDPGIVKRKAYERGVIDEGVLERISDQDAINLVFAPGFSTAETVSDLSGRGVGMDVVRSAIDKVGGSVELQSQVGRGTTLRLSLPLSMAVTNVMIIESDRQIFGVPMDLIVETVRLPRQRLRQIKHQRTTVLRGRIVPLVALNDLLAIPTEPRPNADDELAVLVVRVGSEQVGLLVDDFREVVDVILKPLPGELARLACYAGTALLGDGSVLMILNPRELF